TATEAQCVLDCASNVTTGINANATQRMVGPTEPDFNATYPYAKAPLPLRSPRFCQVGCAHFFGPAPVNTTCKGICDVTFMHNTSVGFNDWAEKARLECRDGCDIALLRCQAGYYCTNGSMLPCPAGTYRETSYGAVTACTPCPAGSYRAATLGREVSDCSLCPQGTFLNSTGSVTIHDCTRCPDGYYGDADGLAVCECITASSCEAMYDQFQRESQPFIGRW
ncbi:unnamed protein product, partial [Phaeothamnion confervicola]